jgi:hypothetical protein
MMSGNLELVSREEVWCYDCESYQLEETYRDENGKMINHLKCKCGEYWG